MKDFFSLKLPTATPGRVIRAHRKNAGLTLKDLCEMTGIAESNLSAIERDRMVLGPERAHMIGAALGLDVEIILCPNGYKGEFQRKLDVVRERSEHLFKEKHRQGKFSGVFSGPSERIARNAINLEVNTQQQHPNRKRRVVVSTVETVRMKKAKVQSG